MQKKISLKHLIILLSFNSVNNIFTYNAPEQISELIIQIQQEKDQFAQKTKDLNNKEYVKEKLAFMVYIDQKVLNALSHLSKEEIDKCDFVKTILKENTDDLKEILQICMWPTIREFGREVDFDVLVDCTIC